MYLDKRGANKEAIDIYGNTPLGVAMLAQHHNYCIIMIQKNADYTKLVHKVDPEKIKKQWEEEEKSKLKGEQQTQIIQQDDDEDMHDSDEEARNKKHRNLFDKQNNNGYDDYGDYDDEDDDDDESEDDSDDDFEQNAFNRNNAFNQTVFAKKTAKKAVYRYGAFGGMKAASSAAQDTTKKDEVE